MSKCELEEIPESLRCLIRSSTIPGLSEAWDSRSADPCDLRSYGSAVGPNWFRFWSDTVRSPYGSFWWMFEESAFGWQLHGGERKMKQQRFRSGVFVSYSHVDRRWLERLRTNLTPYLRDERLVLWDDTKIAPGASWAAEIEHVLGEARVAVLLVTPEFLASDYVARVELPAVLRRARSDLTVMWIPIRASMYEATPLKVIQAAHDPGRPLASLTRPKQDEALVTISKHIAAAVNINAVGNAFRIIDDFEPQAKAFVAGSPEPEAPIEHSWRAEQVEMSIRLVEPGGARDLITAKDFEKLDANAQKLIRAYERTMKDLFERWTELKPKRVAQDPETKREARERSDEVRRDLCQELNGLLGFIESMGMYLKDHYAHVRYICTQPAI